MTETETPIAVAGRRVSAPLFYAFPGASGAGWTVAEKIGDEHRIVSGPYLTLVEAHNEALAMNDLHRQASGSAPASGSEAGLLEAIGDTLRSLALQADRYDDAIAGLHEVIRERTGRGTGIDPERLEAIERTVRAMHERLDALEQLVTDTPGVHSVKA